MPSERLASFCLWSPPILLLVAGLGCARLGQPSIDDPPPNALSAYGLFLGDGSSQKAAPGVVPYDLNTPLFSDYTAKFRFVKLPPGGSAEYSETEVFAFPVGTVIAKTFAYAGDLRHPDRDRRLLETRILRRTPNGWEGLPYIWNEAQTEAYLEVAGGTVETAWRHTDGSRRANRYMVPNVNQCKGCHRDDGQRLNPLGPRAAQLNRVFDYASGRQNQLSHWQQAGVLRGAPAGGELPRYPIWDQPDTGSLDERARAYLEVNCAHCHNPQGPARTSGLDLRYIQQSPPKWGVGKTPVAAGRGSGGRRFSIVPGRPDESILLFRLASTDPGVMMPELGKRLVHDEGVELIREWIARMDG